MPRRVSASCETGWPLPIIRPRAVWRQGPPFAISVYKHRPPVATAGKVEALDPEVRGFFPTLLEC
jgi:hypothetical protein